MKTATLISIGDEILSGSTLDTNSNFIAGELKSIGIKVKQILTISDDISAISSALDLAVKTTDVIITTGGLGPTKDDKTLLAFAQFFQDQLHFSEELYERLKKYLAKRNRLDILDKNKNQCMALQKAKIIDNDYGTAVCQMIEHQQHYIFCLPGVPFEVKPLIKDKILPFLKEKWELNYLVSKTLSIINIPESVLSEKIEQWELSLPSHVSLSYLPIGSRIKLKLSSFGENQQQLKQELENLSQPIIQMLSENIIAQSEEAIEKIVAQLLKNLHYSISTAESCTTGKLARLLTSVSGSSSYYKGGLIPYDSQIKIDVLGVKASTIAEHTVVSAEVAEEMAEKCQKLFTTDIALATTGVAGPNKGEDGKEVGTIYYAIAFKNEVKSFSLFLPHMDRVDFVNFASQKILENLVILLEKYHPNH